MNPTKSLPVAYALWALGLVGLCGVHRFYLGRSGTGAVWLLTLGGFLVAQFIDLFLIPGMVAEANGGGVVAVGAAVPVSAVGAGVAATSTGWHKVTNLSLFRADRIQRFVQGEEVLEAAVARYPGGNSSGCVVLTRTRLLLVRLNLLSESAAEFRWDKVSAVGFERGMLTATITVNAGGAVEQVQLPFNERGRWDTVYGQMRRLQEDATRPAAAAPPVPSPAITEVVREVVTVKVRCAYCGGLVDQGVGKCPHCMARM